MRLRKRYSVIPLLALLGVLLALFLMSRAQRHTVTVAPLPPPVIAPR